MQLQMQGHGKRPKSLQFLPLVWFNCFSLGNQIYKSELLLVCPNRVWPVAHWVKVKAKVFASWGNQQKVEHPLPIAQIIHMRHSWVARTTYLWTTLAKLAVPTIQPTVFGVVHWHIPQRVADNPLHTHCVPIRHSTCLLTLHCALSWRVVKGILQVPQY